MGKLKNIVYVLLFSVLIVLLSAMPGIIAAVQDNTTANSIRYAEMQSVELVLSEKREALSVTEKLILLKEGILYYAAGSNTAMSREDVRMTVEAELAPYYEWEMIPYNWVDSEITATPYLVYSPDNNEMYNMVWEVAIACDTENNFYLNLYLDDETGKILFLNFESAEALDVYDRQNYLDFFCDIYFESLGMSDAANYWEENGLIEDVSPNSGNVTAIRYTFGDAEYGELGIEFYVHTHGFYNFFPR